jgi:hypothetical protein
MLASSRKILRQKEERREMTRKTAVSVVAALFILMASSVHADGFDVEPVVGFGPTLGKVYSETGNVSTHLSAGFTLFNLDKNGHIGLLGAGVAIDFYDFSMHQAGVRDLSRADGGYWGFAGYANAVGTIIPIRVGPLAYQFSWNKHVKSFGLDRGRLHMITLDIIGLIRLNKIQ